MSDVSNLDGQEVVQIPNDPELLNLFNGVQQPPRLGGGDTESDFAALHDWAFGLYNAMTGILLYVDRRLVTQEVLMKLMVKHLDDVGGLTEFQTSPGGVTDVLSNVTGTWNNTMAARTNNNIRSIGQKINRILEAHPEITAEPVPTEETE